MKRVAVLGSTGSIGTNTLDVIAAHPDRLSLVGLAVRSRIDELERQVARHRPSVVAVLDEDKARQLRVRVGLPVLQGVEGLIQLATHPGVDLVVVGTSGPETLLPVLKAIEAGKQIALASKELLVMAGEIVMGAVKARGTSLMPVDSEHAALAQLLEGVPREHIERLVITGTGGPLWSWSAEAQARATREHVLTHPKWRMGPKITVDSATLMNKGLEVIEAHWLFGAPVDRIKVLIHPQAVVHGMVELRDGTCLAQMSACDMRLPIQYALSFPERWHASWPKLRWEQLSTLQFVEPDLERFPCLRLALEAAATGGSACAALSAANDAAVAAYLQDQITFHDIPQVIAHVLAHHDVIPHPTLHQVLRVDRWARVMARDMMERLAAPSPV